VKEQSDSGVLRRIVEENKKKIIFYGVFVGLCLILLGYKIVKGVMQQEEHSALVDDKLREIKEEREERMTMPTEQGSSVQGWVESPLYSCGEDLCINVSNELTNSLTVLLFQSDLNREGFENITGKKIDARCVPEGAYCRVRLPTRVIFFDDGPLDQPYDQFPDQLPDLLPDQLPEQVVPEIPGGADDVQE